MVIRPATSRDAEALAAIYAPVVSETTASFETEPPDAAEVRRRMTARPRLPWLVAEDDGTPAGYAYASPHRSRAGYRWAAECSVYVAEDRHRQGVGRALYDSLIRTVRELGYVTLHAGIALPNPASVALHEAFGFVPVGVYLSVGFKRGAWHDVGWWQLMLCDPPSQPGEPRQWLSPDR